jgi:hypothetical protein
LPFSTVPVDVRKTVDALNSERLIEKGGQEKTGNRADRIDSFSWEEKTDGSATEILSE